MLPTYQPGDLVLVGRSEQYRPGDIVAYRVPVGELGANMILVHRIVVGTATEGLVLLGENNTEEDTWNATGSEIVGAPMAAGPCGGLETNMRNPLVMASLAAGVAFALVAVPKAEPTPGTRPRGRHVRRRHIMWLDLIGPPGAHQPRTCAHFRQR